MGQAKKRGTFEERKQAAIDRLVADRIELKKAGFEDVVIDDLLKRQYMNQNVNVKPNAD